MKTRSKVLIAAAVAVTLGAAGLAGTAYADRNRNWQGMQGGMMGMQGMQADMMGNMMGMHGNRMGRHEGYGRRGMMHMHERIRSFADRYDTDKDGKITQAEIDASRAELFKKNDTNGDGKLSLEEYQNLWLAEKHRKMVRSFQKLDVDGAGAITLDAYNARMGHMVEMLDQNNDGALSRDDMKAWRQFHRERWNMMGNKGQGRMPMMDGDDDDDNGVGASDDQPQQ
jgi:Ca2+-binding EF-hand superfamily protein